MTASGAMASVFTPRGRGAVATVAFVGAVGPIDAAELFRAANGLPVGDQPIGRVAFGRWGEEPAEEVVVCRVAADRLEVHCHGGEAAAGRILGQLGAVGAERVAWREFIERLEGPFAADIADALAAAATLRTAAIVARQAEGPLRNAFRRLSESDPVRQSEKVVALLDSVLRWSEFGRHLTQPWRVVLYGRPNVGKSSLINALVGFERAIVFDRPGTTRDVVTAETAFDGWPVELSDTAGLRSEAEDLEAAGIARAEAALAAADVRILVMDRSRPPHPDGPEHAGRFTPHLIVANKADLPDAWGDRLPGRAITVSARTGEGVREVTARVAATLVPSAPGDDEVVPVSPRQIETLAAARDAAARGDAEAFRRAMRAVTPQGE